VIRGLSPKRAGPIYTFRVADQVLQFKMPPVSTSVSVMLTTGVATRLSSPQRNASSAAFPRQALQIKSRQLLVADINFGCVRRKHQAALTERSRHSGLQRFPSS
jgi:hypothetical protein